MIRFGMDYSIHTLDLHYQNTPETIASYLIIGPEAPILIETGPASTLDALKASLATHNVTLADIEHVLVTHIHLDHSGAAGWLARQGANIFVHHVGARHLIDPTKLLASASRIYLEKMASLWGKTVAAPADRVTAVEDNATLSIGGLSFKTHDTPGHAWHHMAYQLDDVLFAGDALGNRLGARPYTVLPAPPPEFKLDVWLSSLAKIRAVKAALAYPTHFGPFSDVDEHIDQFGHLLNEAAHFVLEQMKTGQTRDQIVDAYGEWDINRGKALDIGEKDLQKYVVSNPIHMSVDGIMRYWTRKGAIN